MMDVPTAALADPALDGSPLPPGSVRLGYIWMIALAAALGGLLFGYDWVVIGGAKPFYEAYFGITNPATSGWAVSSALVGCIIGAPSAGAIADRFGRRPVLMLSAWLFAASAIGVALADSADLFILWRIIGGIGIGLAASAAPLYIAEVSPPDRRGRMVTIYQLMIVVGVLSAQLSNLLIARPSPALPGTADYFQSWNVQFGWRYMFGAQIVPALAFAALLFLIPESPRWLYRRGRATEAERLFARMGNAAFVQRLMDDLKNAAMTHTASPRLTDLLRDPAMARVLLIGAVLPAYQQWCGINIIFNYAADVMMVAGFSVDGALGAIVSTGVVSLVATLLAVRWVETAGRRRLLLWGAASLTVLMGAIGLAQAYDIKGLPILALLLAAIFAYSVTLAPIVWVVLAEIFPARIRGVAMGFSTMILWIASFLLTFSYPFILSGLGNSGSFTFYAAISLFGFLFILTQVRETRGRSLEQIEADYGLSMPAGSAGAAR